MFSWIKIKTHSSHCTLLQCVLLLHSLRYYVCVGLLLEKPRPRSLTLGEMFLFRNLWYDRALHRFYMQRSNSVVTPIFTLGMFFFFLFFIRFNFSEKLRDLSKKPCQTCQHAFYQTPVSVLCFSFKSGVFSMGHEQNDVRLDATVPLS